MAKKKDGNVTIDLGEAIERRLASASGRGKAGKYNPTLGRYSPSYSNRWALGEKMGIPKEVSTKHLIGGAVIGAVANRALYRVVPMVFPIDSKLVVDGIAFGAGLIPFVVRQTPLTLGIALPGFTNLIGSVGDFALDMVGVKKPALSGGPAPAIGSSSDVRAKARQRLADIGNRIGTAQPRQPAPRASMQGTIRPRTRVA